MLLSSSNAAEAEQSLTYLACSLCFATDCRSSTVGHYSFVWGKREQAPQSNGTADISCISALELTEAEVGAISAAHEYGEAQEWKTIAHVLQPDSEYHPALRRALQDYIQQCRFRQLDALLLGGGAANPSAVQPVPAHPLPAALANEDTSQVASDSSTPLTDTQLLVKVRSFFAYHRHISQHDTELVSCKET